jgi:hypothetical protein
VTPLPDGGATLSVRGDADENLVLLDGIPIYHPYQIGGVFSAIRNWYNGFSAPRSPAASGAHFAAAARHAPRSV